jgi:hypothetical protein
MTKAMLITAAFAAALYAQNGFQNPAWMEPPNRSPYPSTQGQPGPVTGKPFSGVETRQTKQVLSDGTPVNKSNVSKIFRDAEGRMRSDGGGKAVMLFDATNHLAYEINGSKCTKRTVRVGDTVIIAATTNGTSVSSFSGSGSWNSNIVAEDLGFQLINGISAKGTRQTLIIPGANLGSDHDVKVVNERWYSDALGILIRSSNVDPRFGSTTYELSEINQSTPDAALFMPPAGCTDAQSPAMRHINDLH